MERPAFLGLSYALTTEHTSGSNATGRCIKREDPVKRLSLCCVLILVATAAQAIIIDDFQTGEYTLGREGTTPPYTVSGTQFDPTGLHILGGQRDVSLDKQSGSTTQPYCNVMAIEYNGIFGWSTYNSSFGCSAVWTSVYGGSGDMNLDLTIGGATAIMVDVISGDMYSGPRPVPLTVTVYSSAGTASVTRQLVLEDTYEFPFNAFTVVDFSDVDRIVFEIVQDSSVNDAVDFALGQFYTNESAVGVEESSWGVIKGLYR